MTCELKVDKKESKTPIISNKDLHQWLYRGWISSNDYLPEGPGEFWCIIESANIPRTGSSPFRDQTCIYCRNSSADKWQDLDGSWVDVEYWRPILNKLYMIDMTIAVFPE